MGKTAVVLGLVLAGVVYCSAGSVGGYAGGSDGGGYGVSIGGEGHGHGGGGGVDHGYGGGGGQHGWGHDYNSHPKYQYAYGVKDSKTWDQKEAAEWRDGHNVKGHYSLREPDGSWRTVQYVSDAGGFRAHVSRTPNHHGK